MSKFRVVGENTEVERKVGLVQLTVEWYDGNNLIADVYEGTTDDLQYSWTTTGLFCVVEVGKAQYKGLKCDKRKTYGYAEVKNIQELVTEGMLPEVDFNM